MKTKIVIGSMSLLGILCACSEQDFHKIGLVNPTLPELKVEIKPEQRIVVEEPKVQVIPQVQVQPPPEPGWGMWDDEFIEIDPEPIVPPAFVQQLKFDDVFKSLSKTHQVIYFDNESDATLTFKEGTKITIKANSFQTESGDPLLDSRVALSVGEYYQLSDLLTGNLNTQTKEGILETGGTIYIEAKSRGQKCELKEGSNIQIEFPVDNKLEDMQVFEGKWKENRIVWEADKSQEEKVEIIEWCDVEAKFPRGMYRMMDFINSAVNYPKDALKYNMQGIVYTTFVVDADGLISDVSVEKGDFKILNDEAIRVIRRMPRWIPGEFDGRKVASRVRLPIYFSIDIEDERNKRSNDQRDAISALNENMPRYGEVVENGSAASAYILAASDLGWINCDRFYDDPREKIDVIVEADPEESLNVKLVFDERRSLMQAFKRDGKYTFNGIPEGEKITIVAVKIKDNECYFAIQQRQASGELSPLDFKKVSMEELDSEMAALNWK